MKKSFEYWNRIDDDSPINCILIWKKILKTNPEILKNEIILKNNIKENIEDRIEKFLELWSHAIQQPNFEVAKKSMHEWQEFWKNMTDENFEFYTKILEILESSWENIQSKNIE